MLTKLLTFLAIGAAIWLMARRALGAKPKVPRAEDYARCPRCGAYAPRGAPCSCEEPPTP